MKTLMVIGLQWGDEGKGKIIDQFAQKANIVMRYQGGANSGHTIIVDDQKVVLHHLPSGIFHKGIRCVLGWGMVITPEVLLDEINTVEGLMERSLTSEDLVISAHCSVVLPIHRRLDAKGEGGQSPIGTTRRGIGPAYEDRIGRRAIRVWDALHLNREQLLARITRLYQNRFDDHHAFEGEIEETVALLESFRKRVGMYVSRVNDMIRQAIDQNQRVLFEGAQGAMLDIQQGTYPFVTSSMTGLSGVYASLGMFVPIEHRLGIAKTYVTRVGLGPFPSEVSGDLAERLQDLGHEYGATTGRKRRVGWMDLVQLRYAVEANGITGIVLTKADVLNGFDQVGVVSGYRRGKETLSSIEGGFEIDGGIEPIIEYLPGWSSVVDSKGQWSAEMSVFCDRIETFTESPVLGVSFGPRRDQIAFRGGQNLAQLFDGMV